MTVAELMAVLERLPGELTVMYVDGEYGPQEVTGAHVQESYGARYVELTE
jgi:hypothetical protein